MTGHRAEPVSLGEAIAWLDRHINLEAIERGVAGRAAFPTTERIRALLEAMGEPQRAYPIVHVTGTNGKGSTTRLCASLLRAQGLSVGTITSPHLEELNERIAHDLVPISDEELFEALLALEQLESFIVEKKGPEFRPTWFEVITAAAYRYFADLPVDAAVVEVGLGGRYDATNAGDGQVAVVTNVELDHVEILGPTRAHIAIEKAGIIKQGSTVVLGEQDPDIVKIFAEEARAVGASEVLRRGIDFDVISNSIAHLGRVLDLRTPGASYDEVFVPLYGAHQGANVATALTAAEAFFGAPLSDEVVREAIAATSVPGRLEVVARHPLVVLDGAHNPAGALAIGAALEEDFAAVERIVVVMGCLRNRDPAELLRNLGTSRVERLFACTPPSPRAQPAEAVAAAAAKEHVRAEVVADVVAALGAALDEAGANDLVLVTGSLYVVGAARRELRRLGSLRS